MPLKAGSALVLMLSLSLPIVPATAGDRYDPYRPGLAPDQVEQIQGIGQSVLSARRGQTPDPDLAALRQHVDNLRRAVEKLHDATMRSGMSDRIRIRGEQAEIGEDLARMEADNRRAERKSAEDEASWTLVRVRSEREALERQTSANSAKGHIKGPAAKVKELEDAMEKLLQSPPQERITQMKALQDRLTASERPIDLERTPTLTSITHHR